MTIKEAFQKLTMVCGAALKNPFFVQRNLHDAFADIADNIVDAGGSTVTVTAELTEGTKIATITVDGEDTDLYAPEGGSGGIDYSTTEQDTGLKWIDGKSIFQKTIILRENSTDKFSKTGYSYINCLPSNYEFIMLKRMYAKRGVWIDCFNLKTELATCFDIENKGFYFQATATYSDIIITIEYTKSST